MIERYFSQAKVLVRLRSGPVGPYLPRFVRALEQRRFSPDTIRRYIRGADSLCRWLDAQGVAVVEANQSHIERYVLQHARLPDIHYEQGRLCKAAMSVPFIATVLREQGILSGSVPVSKTDAWLARFDNHLMRVHGISPESRQHYLRYARRLVQSLQMSEPDWTRLRADQIHDFICCEAAKRKTGSCRLVIAAIRALLRFLAAEGVVPPNLHRAVPAVREWRHASLPQYISTGELDRVLQICHTPTTRCCSRDICIILIMARLGMRAGEVRQLKLDDIDWIEGKIHVRAGKSRRERTLPLLEEVGKALGVYLREERPESAERSIFLTLRPPYRPLACSSAISQISKRILEAAGVQGWQLGAHRLRHTVATHMVRRGSSFKEVVDVLGHASLKSTGIYAKLDERSLQQVALPWPGGVE
jgi:integrase